MKKRIVALAMAFVMVLGTVAVAAGTEKSITVTPMALNINGQTVTPTKSDGTAAEVFAYNGATYVPLRYLSELLGIAVDWDKESAGVAALSGDITLPAQTSGTYTASAQGNNGPVNVEVVVENGAVTAVTVKEHGETKGICDAAIEQIPAAIVAGQTLKVDTVSGATNTSKAILNAVTAALTEAGLDVAAWQTREAGQTGTVAKTEDVTVSTLVVGAGGAGMKAAIDLTKAGHDVLLIEKQPMVGGATALSATYLVVVDTDMQKNAGVATMSVKDYVAHETKLNPDFDANRMTALFEDSQNIHDWLLSIGADFTRPMSYYQIGTSDGSSLGVEMLRVMKAELENAGVNLRLNTKAVSLIEENGTIKGVVAEDEGGQYNIYAENVVLATGGYGASQEAIAKYSPKWVGMPSTTAKGSTGDGHAMAEAVGADFEQMDNVRLNPSVYSDGNVNVSLSAARTAGAIMVNGKGQRFCNEYITDYTTLSGYMMEQEGDYCYLIMDQVSLDSSKRLQGFLTSGYIEKADTIEELAQKIGVPANALKETVKTYGGYVKEQNDKDFGRTLYMNTALETPPYYAAHTQPGIQVTLGGVKVNDELQVVKTDGTAFSNLYAIGELAGDGLFGCAPTTINIFEGGQIAKTILAK